MRDLYCGMVLGLVIGTVSYRSVYAAVFDSRYNHIPLPPFAAKTRFLYFKDGRQNLADVPDEYETQEVDKLVVWSWWKLEPNEQDRVKESFWLKNIRSTKATGCENGFNGERTLPRNQHDIIPWGRVSARANDPSGENIPSSQHGIRTHAVSDSELAIPLAPHPSPAMGTRRAEVETSAISQV